MKCCIKEKLTVKGQGLRFKLSHLQDPHCSVKRGHIQWITSSQQTYEHKKDVRKKKKKNESEYYLYESESQTYIVTSRKSKKISLGNDAVL